MTSQFLVEIWLRKHAALRIRAPRNGEQSMNAAVGNCSPLSYCHYESCFAHRAVRGNKGWNGVRGSIERSQIDLWIWNGILWTLQPGTASSDRRLRVTLRAAIAIK